jgi:hypothetical protein
MVGFVHFFLSHWKGELLQQDLNQPAAAFPTLEDFLAGEDIQ